jgi:hypothetical protein
MCFTKGRGRRRRGGPEKVSPRAGAFPDIQLRLLQAIGLNIAAWDSANAHLRTAAALYVWMKTNGYKY